VLTISKAMYPFLLNQYIAALLNTQSTVLCAQPYRLALPLHAHHKFKRPTHNAAAALWHRVLTISKAMYPFLVNQYIA
jgi:hypothetical protein